MKRKTSVLLFALLVLWTAQPLLTSCTYDASFFKSLELPEECAEGLSFCEGKCVTTNTKEHCGACRNACTFDRLCEKQDDDSYQCRCPEGRADCGPNTKCSLLDGKSNNDLRCGDCNTMCLNNEQCENNACVCPIGDDVLRDDKGKPLSGEALFAEYLKNDDNCGFCGNKCKGVGVHCVLGQCTKTECSVDKDNREECHFSLPDGREECQACEQNCMSKSDLGVGQTALVPKTEYIEVTMRVNDSKFSPKAYTKGDNGGFKLKRVTGCTCDNAKDKENGCAMVSSDRCDDGNCVCGEDSHLCPKDTTCTSQGCKAPCDKDGHACAGSAKCSEQQCLCLGAVKEGESTKGIAHCIDGLVCAEGKCYCPMAAKDDKVAECGVRGDHCVDGKCVCGDLGKACEGDAVCKDKECYCGQSKGCDEILSPHCVNDECVCGSDENNRLCLTNQKCQDRQCVCTNDAACERYGQIQDGRGQANRCNNAGQCVCGNTGGPCPGSRVCVNGKCLCTKDSDCGSNESCDEDSGQCTCGGSRHCKGESYCTAAGYCGCNPQDWYACHNNETCMEINSFGNICICSSVKLQRSCGPNAWCHRSWSEEYSRCKTNSKDALGACHSGEEIKDGACVCGDTGFACRVGQTCIEKHCVQNNTTTPIPPSGE